MYHVEASYDARRQPNAFSNLVADALFIYYLFAVKALREPERVRAEDVYAQHRRVQ